MPTLIPPTNAPIENHTSGLWQNSDAPIQVDHSLCDNSTYVDDISIPDGTVFAPGEPFVKTWMLENTGFCMWKNSTMLKFFEGNSMSGQDTEIGKTIASGRQAKISIELTAPNEEGTYTGYWILADEFGTPFGMPFFVQIVVMDE
jgi:next to BRCA1 gene 1 protein